ncbi:hypothetical protein SAMN04488029_3098 [Reichenbachiella faecimaris]|uniref:Curlin associated repeat-containing protein n=2 Tax=Reichenbachiella faecimaris TaxID=692418 RepID=A0A1W2GK32_REIFA|nr:hypothetical protein SAMN04488029_3098 [Reichenbachiella faecimaris]
MVILSLWSTQLIGQNISAAQEEELLNPNLEENQGVNLIQFGNQNTAQIIQFQDFEAQLSLYQQGQSNYSRVIQMGSGRLNVAQQGRTNHIESYVLGEDMDIDLNQTGQDNAIKQLSIGNNSNYQFMQYGIDNTIEHFNFGKDDASMQIFQRGNDMNLFIYSH